VGNKIGKSSGSITLAEYAAGIEATDQIPADQLHPILMGLYGEVGGVLTSAKKHVREREAYPQYRISAEEEFGDALWYFARLCARLEEPIEDVFTAACGPDDYQNKAAASDLTIGGMAQVAVPKSPLDLDTALFELAQAASSLLGIEAAGELKREMLVSFAGSYLEALRASAVSFAQVARSNVAKARGRFILPALDSLPTFDSGFEPEERIPEKFRIRINQRKSGKSYLQWNKVFIGDPLTDNIADPDGYRFHDVFHLAHAAILHWSPVFRALIKQKRKSESRTDEAQDGGRAIVVEEGLTAWIFGRAKQLEYFAKQDRISFDILKTIQEFVSGYEVDQCPLSLWERAILQGYSVFREVTCAQGGYVIGDRVTRTLTYEPLEAEA
jgi:hypothetical protein